MDASNQFESIAGELYSLPPGEFVPARDQQAKRSRDAGDRQLAAQVRKLRRPTQSAWVVNQLWRQRHELVGDLLGLAEPFREAQREGVGERLRELSTRRRGLLTSLMEHAEQVSGGRLAAGTAREVEGTFEAALADPEVADQIRTGRLTHAASYAGLGPVAPEGIAPPSPTAPHPPQDDSDPAAQRLAEAHREAEQAGVELAARTNALDTASRRRDELTERVEQLQRELRELEPELTEAERDVRTATKQRDDAEARNAEAQRRLSDVASEGNARVSD